MSIDAYLYRMYMYIDIYIYIHIRIHIYIFLHKLSKSQLATEWRRLIGCLKLQVILRKRATNYRALLRKMTYRDKASHDSTPPCTKCGISKD